jgi:hypothetical protein
MAAAGNGRCLCEVNTAIKWSKLLGSLQATKSGSFEDFTDGTGADNAWVYTLASNKISIIHWLTQSRFLVAGTTSGAFRVGSGSDEGITPTNVNVIPESQQTSASIQPVTDGQVTLYIQRSRRKVRELAFSYQSDQYVTNDVSLLSEHLFRTSTIQDVAFQVDPDPVLWVVMADGTLRGMTYDRQNDVIGWHAHSTDGKFESVAVIPHPDITTEQVWFIVNRTINGATKRYVEFFDRDTGFYGPVNTDCTLVYSGSLATTISGLSHLNGKTVNVVGDGAVYPQQTVSGGQIVISPAASKVEVGLHYESKLEILPPEIQGSGSSLQGRPKAWADVTVRLLDTLGLRLLGEVIPFRKAGQPMDKAPPKFSGLITKSSIGFEQDPSVLIEQIQPLPCAVLSISGTLYGAIPEQ